MREEGANIVIRIIVGFIILNSYFFYLTIEISFMNDFFLKLLVANDYVF